MKEGRKNRNQKGKAEVFKESKLKRNGQTDRPTNRQTDIIVTPGEVHPHWHIHVKLFLSGIHIFRLRIRERKKETKIVK